MARGADDELKVALRRLWDRGTGVGDRGSGARRFRRPLDPCAPIPGPQAGPSSSWEATVDTRLQAVERELAALNLRVWGLLVTIGGAEIIRVLSGK